MKPDMNKRGVAMATVIMMLLFLMPLLLSFVKRSGILAHLSTRERMTKTSRTLAMNAVVDYMRQFSQSAQEDHFDPDKLRRTQAFYEAGFTSVVVTTNAATRTLFIRARGSYGDASGNKQQKNLTAVIKFVSDITQFGTMFPNTFTWSGGNWTYRGGFWVRTPNGLGTIIMNNPVTIDGRAVIDGTLDWASGGSMTVNGDLYVRNITANALANLTINGGQRYNFVPTLNPPVLNPAFFEYRAARTVSNTFEDWTFRPDGSVDICPNPGGGCSTPVNVPIPPDGAILLAKNSRLFIRGQVRGRVTVVCTGSGTGDPLANPGSGGAAQVGIDTTTVNGQVFATNPTGFSHINAAPGVVKIEGSLTYEGPTPLSASAQNSLAVMADNCIILETNPTSPAATNPNLPTGTNAVGQPTYLSGLFYVANEQNSANVPEIRRFKPTTRNGPAQRIEVSGVRAALVSDTINNSYTSGAYPTYGVITTLDPNLQNFPPPGLPESPLLVTLDFN